MNKNELIVTEFDQVTTRGSTQIIKALIPYLSPREQKMMAIMVRIWEFILTLRFFEKDFFPSREYGNNTDMINNLKRYCTPESQNTIDMILKFMNMSELMNIINVFDMENLQNNPFSGNLAENIPFSGGNFADIMNMFNSLKHAANDISNKPFSSSIQPANIIESMMNPNQENLFEEFMEKLNQKIN